MPQPTFNPSKDIPDLSGKVILITGGTAGLGTETLQQLAKHKPAELYFTGRNAKAAAEIISGLKISAPSVKVTFIKLDLLSLSSIKAAQPKLPSERLDILICNAGIMARPPALSKDGYEIQFATNHLAHALLIKFLLPTMLRTAESTPTSNARIVILTSLGFSLHPKGGILFKDLKTPQDLGAFGSWRRYGQSKLANILYASELARRYSDRGISAVSIHPGVVSTGIADGLSFANRALVRVTTVGQMVGLEEGAWNTLWAATRERGGVRNGAFYEPVGLDCTEKRLDKVAKDVGLAKELWEWTEGELRDY